MLSFLVKEKIRVALDGKGSCTLLPPGQTMIPGSDIPGTTYITTASGFARMGQSLAAKGIEPPLAPVAEARVKDIPGFPVELGTQKYGELQRNLHISGIKTAKDPAIFHPPPVELAQQLQTLPGRPLRIAILNGLGGGIGDTVVGLTALRAAVGLIKQHAEIATLDAVLDTASQERLAHVLRQSGLFGNIHTYPLRLPEFMKYDAYFDMGGVAHLDDFNSLPFLDFFLKAMGITPASVPAKLRRNKLKIDAGTVRRLEPEIDRIRADGSPLLLFHPTATAAIRSAPTAEHERLIERIRTCFPGRIVTVSKDIQHLPGVTDLSVLSKDFAAYCYIISRMDRILTVDTSIYHIADSFSVPTAVWFTTIDPGRRIDNYPFTAGILLENDPASGILGKHASLESADLARIKELWSEVDPQDALRLLDEITEHT